MKHELIIGTKNQTKISQIKSVLEYLNIDIFGLPINTNVNIIENGNTAQENARKKAKKYSEYLNKTVLSTDNALYFNNLEKKYQPGVHVKRVDKVVDSSNNELLEYYQDLITKLGNNIEGCWEFAICIASPNREIKEHTIKLNRIFTNSRGNNIIVGYPLESLQIDPKSKKHISDMNKSELHALWKDDIGLSLQKLIKEYFNI